MTERVPIGNSIFIYKADDGSTTTVIELAGFITEVGYRAVIEL